MTRSLAPNSAVMPWRYGLFVALCFSTVGFAFVLPWYEAVMAGFDFAALAYFATLPALFKMDVVGIRKQAEPIDADKILLLGVTALVMVAIMAAVTAELTQKDMPSRAVALLTIGSLALAWCFSNMVYALHYAHLFYDRGKSGKDRGGLQFPDTKTPEYWDFVYFSYTLGMTFQTSDVSITDAKWRKIVTMQCLAAFIFNIGIIAFSINILAG